MQRTRVSREGSWQWGWKERTATSLQSTAKGFGVGRGKGGGLDSACTLDKWMLFTQIMYTEAEEARFQIGFFILEGVIILGTFRRSVLFALYLSTRTDE